MKQTKKQKKNVSSNGFLSGLNISVRVVRALVIVGGIFLLLLASLFAGVGLGYFNSLIVDTTIPDKATLEKQINDIDEVSSLAFADGTEFATISSDLVRTRVNSDEIAPIMKKAVVSTEDEYFFDHNGWVPKAVIRSLLGEFAGFGDGSGGSTLTQQLVKQQILGDDPTFERKANEILLATQIEKHFSKDEIITTYLNVSPFGRNNRGQNIAGVEEAAMGIFGVHASELNIPQAAFIAGLPQSPIVYSPYDQFGNMRPVEDLQIGLTRQRNVLFNMFRNGFITEDEYNDALNYDLIAHFQARADAPVTTNSYLYYAVLGEAQDILARQMAKDEGVSEEELANPDVYNGFFARAGLRLRLSGYKVVSTIDQNIYMAMQEATANWSGVLDVNMPQAPEVGNVIIDNKTGAILGFVGGRDFTTNQLNHAFDIRRNAGSTIKPLLVYGPAIEQGWMGSESMLSDFPTNFRDGSGPIMHNTSAGLNKFVDLRYAIEVSLNIPAYWTYQQLVSNGLDIEKGPRTVMREMNFTQADIADDTFGIESIPMGGGVEISPRTMINGFQTFANLGEFNQAFLIDRIEDGDGNVVFQHEVKPTRVFTPATASIMNDLMRTVITKGTTTPFLSVMANQVNTRLAQADWVGKTGTSNDFRDAWLIISTPGITTGSWMGMQDNSPMNINASRNNSTFLAYLLNAVYQVRPDIFQVDARFNLDPSVIRSTVSSFTGQKPGTVTVDGHQVQTPGPNVTSFWALNGAPASTYRFGVGGTDADFKKVWGAHLPDEEEKKEEDKDKEESSTTTTTEDKDEHTDGTTSTNENHADGEHNTDTATDNEEH